MRVMALDMGDVRVGIAISDPDGRIATPIAVLDAAEVTNHGKRFQRLLEDWQPDQLLVGLPLTLAGEEGPQAQTIRTRAESVAARCDLPLAFVDERLSSAAAKRSLREMGKDARASRGKVDMIAASLFLQAWLDAADVADVADATDADGANDAADLVSAADSTDAAGTTGAIDAADSTDVAATTAATAATAAATDATAAAVAAAATAATAATAAAREA